jgi:transcriptional regulator with XRE-family HTH domain
MGTVSPTMTMIFFPNNTQKHSWNKGFKQFREQLGISQKDLAEELNIRQSTVSQAESGLVYPGFTSLAYLVTHKKLNPAWLITGEEEMMEDPDSVSIYTGIRLISSLLDCSSPQNRYFL